MKQIRKGVAVISKSKEEYLLERYRKVATIWVENPYLKYGEIARLARIGDSTFYDYRHDERFMAIYKELCQEKYKELESVAMNKLGEMAAAGNWNAVKYILDGVGYKPEDKTKVAIESAPSINLTIGE